MAIWPLALAEKLPLFPVPMPLAPPVMTAKPAFASRHAVRSAARYCGSPGGTLAEPNTATAGPTLAKTIPKSTSYCPNQACSVWAIATAAGGCDNTTVAVDEQGVVQTTNAARSVASGAHVPLRGVR